MEGKVNNKFSNLPAGWEVKKLKDLFYINELALPANTPSDFQFRYIPIEKVSTNHIDYENCEQFEFQDAPGRARRIIRQNDILISGVRPNLKSFAIFKKPDDKNWICSTGFFVLTAKQPEDNLISYYELLSEICGSQFYSLVVGTNYPAIGDSDIRNIRLMLPSSKEEKTAVANILTKVDEAIASVQNSITAAERLKKSLMQNLLTGKMKPDGTFRTSEEFYIDDKFGKVPVGWEVKRIKDFGEVQTGKTPPTDEPEVFSDKENGFMFVTPGDLDVTKYIEETERYVSEKGIRYSYVLPKGTVCEVCIGSTIGKIGITTATCCSNQQITSVIVNNEHDAEYLYYAMLSRREHFKSVAGINATPQINKSGYSKYRVLCPKDKLEQIAIAKGISSVDKSINEQKQKIKFLERLKKSLMQNLLTGKVTIIRS